MFWMKILTLSPLTQQASDYCKLWGQKYNEHCQSILTCTFKGITTSIYELDLFPTVHQMVWAALTQLVSHYFQIWPRSGFFSQNSNSMPSPTTNIASKQSSHLEHLSYFSNPLLMDESNLQSLHLDTNCLPTPTWSCKRQGEPSSSLPLSPASSIPHQCPHSHTYASHFLSTLTIAPPHYPPYFVH